MSKILVVDDDVTVTQLLKMLLTMEGHQPTLVNDSTKALDAADSVRPDLITLDLMMPGLSGFELCALLHQDPRFAKVLGGLIDAEQGARIRQALAPILQSVIVQ